MKNHSASLLLAVRHAAGVFVGLAFAGFAVLGLATEPQNPPGMAWIPGGEFAMGNNDCRLNHRPSPRRGTDFDTGLSHLGFRCVLSPGRQEHQDHGEPKPN